MVTQQRCRGCITEVPSKCEIRNPRGTVGHPGGKSVRFFFFLNFPLAQKKNPNGFVVKFVFKRERLRIIQFLEVSVGDTQFKRRFIMQNDVESLH